MYPLISDHERGYNEKIGILLFITGGFLFVSNLPHKIFNNSTGALRDNIVVAQIHRDKSDASASSEKNLPVPGFLPRDVP